MSSPRQPDLGGDAGQRIDDERDVRVELDAQAGVAPEVGLAKG